MSKFPVGSFIIAKAPHYKQSLGVLQVHAHMKRSGEAVVFSCHPWAWHGGDLPTDPPLNPVMQYMSVPDCMFEIFDKDKHVNYALPTDSTMSKFPVGSVIIATLPDVRKHEGPRRVVAHERPTGLAVLEAQNNMGWPGGYHQTNPPLDPKKRYWMVRDECYVLYSPLKHSDERVDQSGLSHATTCDCGAIKCQSTHYNWCNSLKAR